MSVDFRKESKTKQNKIKDYHEIFNLFFHKNVEKIKKSNKHGNWDRKVTKCLPLFILKMPRHTFVF